MSHTTEPSSLLRRVSFETFEDRLVLSADPVADFFADFSIPRPAPHVGEIAPTLADAHRMTGVDYVRENYGLRGAGQTVVVIDSGIAYDHQYLGGGFGAGYKVVGGWDFAENDANPYDDGPAGFHGTHVAGIIGNNHATHSGVAPGVDLVALRVFSDTGAGYFSWVEDALAWVHENRHALANPITTVNLSLGTNWNSDSIPGYAMLEDELAQLERDGIFIAVSAGNSFATYNQPGLSYPAASSYVVPVASVDDNGNLSAFSQRNGRVLAAPGESIASTVPDYVFGVDGIVNDWAYASGTSMAAPYVAGASVLVREAMELFGAVTVTQDAIYDHLRNTADLVFDGATSAFYHRINVQAAIEALAPADDFGSTVADAHSLGVLNGDTTLAGLIGRLDDRDFFTFTAGAAGRVTLNATTGGYLQADWAVEGGGGTLDGGALSLDVVAGQTYTFSLGTGDGIGSYDLDIDFVAAMVDWGVIESQQMQLANINGESWFMMTAGRVGLLTVEAAFDQASGALSLSLYDANMQMLSAVDAPADSQRVDVAAEQGGTYYLRAAGGGENVEFRLSNLVSVVDGQLTAFGTAGDDTIIFDAAAFALTINGVSYQGAALAGINSLIVEGAAGNDTVTVYGASGDETATMRVGSVEIEGAAYRFAATGVESVFLFGRGGNDTAHLFDSAGNDRFVGRPERSWITGDGFLNQVEGFEQVFAYATAGDDEALLYDSAGDDRFVGRPERSWITGSGYLNQVEGFDRVVAHASSGLDTSMLFDSHGDDRFVGQTGRSWLTGGGFTNQVEGFDQVVAYASAGGNDTASLYGSSGNDRFTGRHDRSWLTGTNFLNQVEGFDQVFAYGGGGNDTAYMYDSAGDDRFVGYSHSSWITGDGYLVQVADFNLVIAYATLGGTDTAMMHDSTGNDRFVGRAERSWMTAVGYVFQVERFERVFAYSTAGGYDYALLYDSAGNDLFVGRPQRSWLTGAGFLNQVEGFDLVVGYARAGGYDTAILYDSVGNDRFYGRTDRSWMVGAGFVNQVEGFDRVLAYSSAGGLDTARLYDSAGNDRFVSRGSDAMMVTGSFYNFTRGFGRTYAYTDQGGYDTAVFEDLGTGDTVGGSDRVAYFRNSLLERLAYGFDFVTAIARNGHSPTDEFDSTDYHFERLGSWID